MSDKLCRLMSLEWSVLLRLNVSPSPLRIHGDEFFNSYRRIALAFLRSNAKQPLFSIGDFFLETICEVVRK